MLKIYERRDFSELPNVIGNPSFHRVQHGNGLDAPLPLLQVSASHKKFRRHDLQTVGDGRPKIHVSQNIPVQVDSRCDLN